MRRLVRVMLLAMTGITAGCGYSAAPLISPAYKTIAVDIFQNETRYRDFEFVLANALKNEIVSKTNLTLAPRSEAETQLKGSILSYEEHVVTETHTDQVRELEVKITVAYEWRDLRTGQVIHERKRFTKTADAKFPLGQTRDSAAAEVLADVAEDLINDLEAEW